MLALVFLATALCRLFSEGGARLVADRKSLPYDKRMLTRLNFHAEEHRPLNRWRFGVLPLLSLTLIMRTGTCQDLPNGHKASIANPKCEFIRQEAERWREKRQAMP